MAASTSARSATPSRPPGSALTRSTSAGSNRAPPPRGMERRRALTHPDRPLGQGTRWSLLIAPERQTIGRLATLWEVQAHLPVLPRLPAAGRTAAAGLEGLNSKIRFITPRSLGARSARPVIALVYLCHTGIDIKLPR